jgi:deoxyribodipyrimidine photolyase-related protein
MAGLLGRGENLLGAMQARLAPRHDMKTLRFILGDQLTREIAALTDLDRARDVVLMAEVGEETTYVPHHKQKIALILSAMRHFADELRGEGIEVDYVELEDPANSGSFTGELERAVQRHCPDRVVVTAPGEWRVAEMARGWSTTMGLPVDVREDDRFYCSTARFRRWAEERKTYRMEFFYREMRRETGLLMDGDEPAGGRWNYDAENRKRLPKGRRPPAPPAFAPDAITKAVIDLVARRFAEHFGDLEGFAWATTRADALHALAHFIDYNLFFFGDYQDAMAAGEPFLHHAVISPYLNLGLLTAREICAAAERAYRSRSAPLAAVEGFVRQILGWREFMRGVYWLRMPGYAQTNALGAMRALPEFYWSGDTGMACVAAVVGQTRRHAYAHHIQRLMVTGNFALLAGIAPTEVEAWYLAVYTDAYEWVELPNTHGMALYADDGLLASKPYAASGAYIDKMSDYCAGCRYDPKGKSGADACPFNYLYWNFLIQNRFALSANPRLAMPYRTLDAMGAARIREIEADSRTFLAGL